MSERLVDERRQKVEQMRAEGENPFANDFRVTHTTAELRDRYGDLDADALTTCADSVSIGGRLMASRSFGRVTFGVLNDRAGSVQVGFFRDELSDEVWGRVKRADIGDIIGVEGVMMRTKTGELSVKATAVRVLAKSLRPLPDKWHGLTDTATRYRQRYVDLIVNPEVRETFKMRSRVVRYIRHFLDSRDFMEVETPMLQSIYGGAAARPFVTHHNALDMRLYLRIAPELNLKRPPMDTLRALWCVTKGRAAAPP